MSDVVLILNGRKTDRGFVQEGFDGATRAADRLNLSLEVVEHISGDAVELERHVAAAAHSGARGVIVHGSRADAPIERVAPGAPGVAFLSPGGHAAGTNVWNYAVRHYEAAFLAGILAARLTATGTVGHLSGVPIAPGKRGRAAYVGGVRHADPDVRLVTGFCGTQDDPALARAWTEAQISAGVDVLFTMLNFGRTGAIEACRAAGIRQIGNIRDWTVEEPDVFVGSALARHGWSIDAWLGDLVNDALRPGVNRSAGLDTPAAVHLALAPGLPAAIRAEIDAAARAICAGDITIPETYDGPEFAPDTR